MLAGVIASVTIRNYRALKSAGLSLMPFNLVIGPNGSGKTSLVHAVLRLRALAKLPLRNAGASEEEREKMADAPELCWQFMPPYDGLEAVMKGLPGAKWDFLDVTQLPSGQGRNDWAGLRSVLTGIRAFVLDPYALAERSLPREGAELRDNGANLASVLAALQKNSPEEFGELRDELCRILPEYDDVQWAFAADGTVELSLRLAESGELIPGERLSQGTLYLLAMMSLAFDPRPPPIVCIEEVDRGFHPRLLRDVRDVLYRLSYPEAHGLRRAPVQVIATTHSPYMLDLFSEHPEEVVLSEKRGAYASLRRLSERKDLLELLAEGGGGLGDMWFTGILGGVPQESSLRSQIPNSKIQNPIKFQNPNSKFQ
jgi:energy-coupling factor transporter ATP-binding protein EcfA2